MENPYLTPESRARLEAAYGARRRRLRFDRYSTAVFVAAAPALGVGIAAEMTTAPGLDALAMFLAGIVWGLMFALLLSRMPYRITLPPGSVFAMGRDEARLIARSTSISRSMSDEEAMRLARAMDEDGARMLGEAFAAARRREDDDNDARS